MKQNCTILLLWVLCWLPGRTAATVYTLDNLPDVHRSDARQYVSNPDGILAPETVGEMNRIIRSTADSTSAEIAVVVVESIGDEEIKPFATALFGQWGIGKKDNDNGLLILFVLDQRQITFETGYGLEGVLPDALCKRIQMQEMIPAFREGDYDKGMLNGLARTADILTRPEAADEIRSSAETAAETGRIPVFTLYIAVSLILSLLHLLWIRSALRPVRNGDKYTRYRALVPCKSTAPLFAVLFPVFAAFTWIWLLRTMRKLRNGKHPCDRCGHAMLKLGETEDNLYLTPQGDTEERIRSVDYDVWRCDSCGNIKIYPYENAYTRYTKCQRCQARARSLERDVVLIPPTTVTPGKGEKIYRCAHCGEETRERYTIPIIIVPAAGNRGSGGGFGGGGSFGGGHSGGGGATSRW